MFCFELAEWLLGGWVEFGFESLVEADRKWRAETEGNWVGVAGWGS